MLKRQLDLRTGTSTAPRTDVDALESGFLLRRYLNRSPGASSSSLQASGVQADALSTMLLETFVTPGSQQTFGLQSRLITGAHTNSGAGANTDKVALYGSVERGSGSSDPVWAQNLLTSVTNLGGPTLGIEIDMANKSNIDPDIAWQDSGNTHVALSIVSGAARPDGTAILVQRNGGYRDNGWYRGVYIRSVVASGRDSSKTARPAERSCMSRNVGRQQRFESMQRGFHATVKIEA
jgi:hypothetical protein